MAVYSLSTASLTSKLTRRYGTMTMRQRKRTNKNLIISLSFALKMFILLRFLRFIIMTLLQVLHIIWASQPSPLLVQHLIKFIDDARANENHNYNLNLNS